MKSPEEEIEEALREDPDSDERWEHVVALHRRGDEATFRAAASLLVSDEPARRALGADILAQLGAAKDVPVAERKYAGPAVELLLERIGTESDSEVLISMTHAFGHLHDPRCVPFLQELGKHPDEDVRYGVVFGLLALDDERSVATLIELSADTDQDVRDWATFGLGSQIERDDPTIREALLARLDDPHDNVRGEALRGLGARGDARAIPQLLVELERGDEVEDPSLVEEALLALAAATADERLCPHIQIARAAWEEACPGEIMPDDLTAAVAACAARSN